MPGDEVEGRLRIELSSAVGDHRDAVVQTREEHIDQAADPGPVRGGPEQIVVPGKEIMGQLDPGEVTQKHAMRVQCPLGRPRGPRCIDDQRGVIRSGEHRIETTGRTLDRLPEADRALGLSPLRHENGLQERQPCADLLNLVQVGAVRHDRLRLAVSQSVLECVGSEQGEQGNRDRSDLVDGDVGEGRFRTLREQDTDPISLPDPAGLERIGQPVRKRLQVPERVLLILAVFIFVDQCQAVSLVGPLVADVDPDVVELGHAPFERPTHIFVCLTPLQHAASSSFVSRDPRCGFSSSSIFALPLCGRTDSRSALARSSVPEH